MSITIEMGIGRWRAYTGITLSSYTRLWNWAVQHEHAVIHALVHEYAHIAHSGSFYGTSFDY